MIVDTMTDEEVAKIRNKDYEDEVRYHMINIIFDNRYTRFINKNLKAEQEYCFKTIKHITKAGNVFYLIPRTKGKREFKREGLIVTDFMIYRRNNLLYAISGLDTFYVSGKEKRSRRAMINFVFTPHLFDRYRERHLKNQEISKLDTIIEFFRNMSELNASTMNKCNKYKDSIFIAIKDGIVLGSVNNNNTIECKTFVSNEMLKDNQTDFHELLGEIAKPCCCGKN